MLDLKKLHNLAMDCYENALLHKLRGNREGYAQHLAQATDYEIQAAQFLLHTNEEPTRSQVIASAVNLCLEANRLEAAMELIRQGRVKGFSADVAVELRTIEVAIAAQTNPVPAQWVSPSEARQSKAGMLSRASADEGKVTILAGAQKLILKVADTHKMDEIVRFYWRKRVRVTYLPSAKSLHKGQLISIEAEENNPSAV